MSSSSLFPLPLPPRLLLRPPHPPPPPPPPCPATGSGRCAGRRASPCGGSRSCLFPLASGAGGQVVLGADEPWTWVGTRWDMSWVHLFVRLSFFILFFLFPDIQSFPGGWKLVGYVLGSSSSYLVLHVEGIPFSQYSTGGLWATGCGPRTLHLFRRTPTILHGREQDYWLHVLLASEWIWLVTTGENITIGQMEQTWLQIYQLNDIGRFGPVIYKEVVPGAEFKPVSSRCRRVRRKLRPPRCLYNCKYKAFSIVPSQPISVDPIRE